MKFPAFKNKKEVARFLADGYRESGSLALADVNVLKLIADRASEFYMLLSQPNIDVLWYDPDKDELNGIIVKYFRQKAPLPAHGSVEGINELGDQLKPSKYYAGVGEALAVLNYGLDYSWLFHVFDDNVSEQLAEFAYNSALKVLSFTPIVYMVVVHSEAKMLTSKIFNPHLNNDEMKKLRKIIIESLKLAHNE